MANGTIDIIYRFIAKTEQFEKEVKELEQTTAKVGSEVKAPSFKEMGGSIEKAHRELHEMVKDGKLTAREAQEIRKEFAQARGEAARLARILEDISKRRGRVAPGFAPGELSQLQQASRGRQGLYQYEGSYVPGDIEDFNDAMDRTFQKTNKGVTDLRTNTKAGQQELIQFGKEFAIGMHRGGEEIDNVNKKASTTKATMEDVGRALMVKGFSFYGIRLLGASVVQIGQLMTVLGGAATGGIFKAASDYIKNAPEANETTRAWAEQMQRVEKSQARIGKVLASETIPFLKVGADLLGRLARFLEQNPEAAGAALKAGLLLTGIGAMTMLVGKGINLVADISFIAASINMLKSGDDNIIASGVMLRASKNNLAASAASGKGAAAGAAGGLAGLAKTLVPLAAFTAGLIAADKAFDAFEGRDVTLADYFTTLKQAVALFAKGIGDILEQMYAILPGGKRIGVAEGTGEEWFRTVAEALGLIKVPADEAADSLLGLSEVLANSLKRDEVLEAYEDYKADDMELVRKHYDDRKKVIDDALSAEIKANQELARDIQNVYADLGKGLRDATADYRKDEAKSEAQYAQDRRKILEGAGEQQLERERDLQEKLRKLRMEYEQRETDLLAQRDAVGLVKNRQKYLQDRAELTREANQEVAQRRRETAQRLAELQREFEEERKERFAEWKAKLLELRQQATEEIKELREKHAAELREIQLNRNARLRELDIQLREERNRRYNDFIARVRDLDAALLGEQALRKQHQDAMLRELDSFLARYRSGMGSLLTSIPSRQGGGYVSSGIYRLHNNEYVLSPTTTAILEQMMGRRLTQEGILGTVGAQTQVTWNDSRRFDSRLQPADRRAITQDTLGVLGAVLGA